MNTVFKVDSSSQMGIGHLMCCLTLADKLKQHDHDIFFVCRDLEENLISLFKYPKYILSKNNNFNVGVCYSEAFVMLRSRG
jgi:spore coat polysaccharide biosynthesis predicted glycosyltransferase SpsG